IVHIAPGCGAEDYDLGKEVGADITLSPLDGSGHFVDGYGDMVGKFAHDVTDEVIAYLKEQGSLYKTEEITHSYPHCWRCGTKSLFRLEDNWFINIEKIRAKLKEKAADAKWIPEFAGYRMQDWLNNMGDWMISRKRFYGLSLPFYECSACGELVVVGSKEELKERAVNPEVVDSLPSLHRPWIDEVAITCPSCGKEVRRIQDVGDCWLDAGVVPFSTLKYFEDRSYWEKWFPANYIIEMIEQVRLWFYSMLVYGVMFENEVPYKVVGNYGEVRDENGIRFSKSKVNYIPFDEAAEKAGSDVIRWVYVTQSPGTNLRFGWSVTEDVRRRFYLPVWNLYCYLVTYANQHGFSPDKVQDTGSDSVMDRWVLAELNEVIERVTESLEAYDASTASRRIEQFVTDLSTWYVRRSRDRFMKGDLQALSTLYTVMTTLARLLAPFTPFIAEEMMRNLRRKDDPESIHLADFPESNSSWADPELTKTMKQARAVAALGQSARVSAGIRVRQPLSELQVSGVALEDELLRIIADEMNVKTVTAVRKVNEAEHWVVQKDKALTVSLNTELSGELMVEGLFRDVVRKVQQSRKDAGLKPGEPVKVTIVSQNDSVRELVSQKNEELKQSVSASDVVFTDAVPSEGSREHGISVTID
ncbi:MAG: class I tRNA ligase family protein, partial [Candidatus Dojkabacteria bacterium]|nr:class I tRNA ligase family protein [Candidatus Dojkabacteria bacterium]